MNGPTPDRLKAELLRLEGMSHALREEHLLRLRGEDEALELELRSLLGHAPSLSGPIGPYHVTGLLGAGGMGVVYRAEQRTPFRREVALKVLRGGLDPQRLRRRFDAERQALARLDHPGIARVFDTGTDNQGTPWVAMELVQGIPITRHVRLHRLAEREVVELFVDVCRAVQHAHQRGVVHRDLKPANLLVTEADGRPAPKVIDFGLAQLLEDDPLPGGVQPALTHEGQVLGTLEYMSPEQAPGQRGDTDTRSDVFSLGAVLCELLTGRAPRDLSGRSLGEALAILAREPARPFGPNRPGAPRVDADLRTVILKALELEPSRRYDNAGALADDLERWLRAEPVLARRASATYLVRKFAQRHRVVVAIAGSAVVLLAAFAITMAVMYQGQRRERQRAEAEAARAKAISNFMASTLGEVQPASMARDVTMRDYLDRAQRALQGRTDLPDEVRAGVLLALGTSHMTLGRLDEADSLLGEAWQRTAGRAATPDPQAIEALTRQAEVNVLRGLTGRADSIATLAVVESRRLQPTQPRMEAHALVILGHARFQREHSAGVDSLAHLAIRRLEQAQDTSNAEMFGALNLRALALYRDGHPAEADSVWRRARRHPAAAGGEESPSVVDVMSNVAINLHGMGRLVEAESLYRHVIRIEHRLYGDRHVYVANTMLNLSGLLTATGRPAAGLQMLEEVARIQEASLPAVSGARFYRMDREASAWLALHQPARALAIARPLVQEIERHPEVGGPSLPSARSLLAAAQAGLGQLEEAGANYRQAMAEWDSLRRTRNTAFIPIQLLTEFGYGRLLYGQGRLAEARTLFDGMVHHPMQDEFRIDYLRAAACMRALCDARMRPGIPATEDSLRTATRHMVRLARYLTPVRATLPHVEQYYAATGRRAEAQRVRAALLGLPGPAPPPLPPADWATIAR